MPTLTKATNSRCRLDRDVPKCLARSAAYHDRSGCNSVAARMDWRVRGISTSIRRGLIVRILRYYVRNLNTCQRVQIAKNPRPTPPPAHREREKRVPKQIPPPPRKLNQSPA